MASSTNRNFSINRANDFMYDSSFTVPTEKDFDKHAFKASLATAQLGIAPVYDNMFSDLKTCPRQTIVMKLGPRCTKYIGERNSYEHLLGSQLNVDVAGTDRTKFFNIPTCRRYSDISLILLPGMSQSETKFRSKGVQTVYRESSAQTNPWKSKEYVVMDGSDRSDPEILKLKFLNNNLPPGMHEVDMIIRARNRRAWELLLPDVEDAKSLEERHMILEAVELDTWAFREDEIAHIQALRLKILERMLQEVLDNMAARNQGKLERIKKKLLHEHHVEMSKMKHNKERELRRLYRKNFGVGTKYKLVNVVDEHADFKSEIYAPLMRHGEHPKRGYAEIKLEHYKPILYNIKHYSTLPRWLFDRKIVDLNNIKLPGRRLCIRETKWTEPVLKQLHIELSNLHRATKVKSTLRERRKKPQILEETMVLEFEEKNIDEIEAILLLQSIIRGRATQTLIYEGRHRCRKLIEELQSTHFLDLSQYEEMKKKRMEVLGQQRNKQILWEREANLEMALNQLQGNVLGTMLDFLSKELIRIKDERKAHALALLYERERRDKETAEAGRRQKEERRRREHDEMFKHVVKVDQDSVDLYLQDIITEGIEHTCDVDAKHFVKKLAAQVEEEAQHPPTRFVEKEELIADMVCHFLIPEVEKTRIRNKMKKQQEKHLRCAHDAIYNKIEKLPKFLDDIQDACLEQSSKETKSSSSLRIHDYVEHVLDEQIEYSPGKNMTIYCKNNINISDMQRNV